MTDDVQQAPHKKRSGRRVGPTSSHDMILDAARGKFSEQGFEGATMRAIATAANVDSALIHHFFLSKDGLFMAAVQDAFTVPDLVPLVVDGEPEEAGERLAHAFLAHWEDPGTRPRLESLIRSVRSFEGATETIRDFLEGDVLQPVTAALGHGRPELRAALIGTQLIGLAYLRFVLRVEPLASMGPRELAACVGGTCQGYLTGRL
ncbi:MAG: TetR family transcriptional regulator [Umezawaea sp.]